MERSLLRIDGSRGEGGGQVLRSALALSLVTGRPFAIDKIRAARRKPGLLRQHLMAVRAAAAVGAAEVDGAALGSSRLVFRPQGVRAGTYAFRIDSAGSATLVLQTVLPALLTASGESHLTLEGGTHNPLAPPFDFLARTYLPLVNRLGPRVDARLLRHGFYPAGGGQFTVHVQPAATLQRLELTERGPLTARRVRALVACLPRHIAERECRLIGERTGWDPSCLAVETVADSRGPGNVVLIEMETPHVTEIFAGFGQKGVRAETVAEQVLHAAEAYERAGVPVGEHLADQLLLPLAIGAALGSGGGVFRTLDLSSHAATQLEILRHFLPVEIRVQRQGPDDCLVHVG